MDKELLNFVVESVRKEEKWKHDEAERLRKEKEMEGKPKSLHLFRFTIALIDPWVTPNCTARVFWSTPEA